MVDVAQDKYRNLFLHVLSRQVKLMRDNFTFISSKMTQTEEFEQKTLMRISRRKYLIGPIVFFHLLTFTIYSSTMNLFYPYFVGQELFPNVTLSKERNSFCFSNINASRTNENTVQAVVAEYSVYLAICMGIPSVISNVLIGSISDCYGRKRLLLVPTVGLLVAEVIIVVFIHLKVSLYYFLIPSIILAGLGDIFAVIQISLSLVSDITEMNNSRTVGIALMEMAIGIGILLGGISAGYLIQSIGYMWTVCLACVVKVCNISLIFLLPETFQPKKKPWSITFVLQSVKKSFEFYYSKEFKGIRWKYNLTLAIFILGNMTVVGKSQVEVLYIISSPFCLTPVLVGWFNAVKAVMQQAIAMILVRVFLMCCSNEFIAIFGALSGIAYFVIEIVARSTVVLFLGIFDVTFTAPVFGFGMILGPVIIRAIMSVETANDKQGALFGGLAAIQTIFSFFGSLVFNEIYKNTVHVDNRFYLESITGLFFVTLILSIILYIKSKKKRKKYTVRSKELDIVKTEN